jgi:sec-independent protein translocase protein TatC
MAKAMNDKPMSIGEHLEELRKRVFLAIVGVLPIFGVGLYFGRKILGFIIAPLEHELKKQHVFGSAQTSAVLEGFLNWLKIAMVLAVVVGGPWIIYQVWKFIAPGLYARERRFFYFLSPLSVMFSCLGVAFMYYVMLPFVLLFFVKFNDSLIERAPTPIVDVAMPARPPSFPEFAGDPKDPRPGEIWINTERGALRIATSNPDARTPEERASKPPLILNLPFQSDSFVVQQYKINEYVNLVLTFAFAFALTFQTPVVVLLLGWMGFIDPKTIGKYRKWALLACTGVAAIVTPPDFFSMISLMVPMYLLFELGIILLRIMPAKKVAEGRILSRGTEIRDGARPGGDDPSARPDDR